MATMRIRIGAVRDRSFDIVLSDMEKRSARTAKVIEKNFSKSTKVKAASVSDRPVKALEKERRARQKLSFETRKAIALEVHADKAAHRARLKNIEKEAQAKLKAIRVSNRAAGIGGGGRGGGGGSFSGGSDERRAFARRTSHRATRFLLPNAPIGSMASRGVSDFARGAGIETTLGGMVSRVRGAEDLAVAISNKGYTKGARGPKGTRVSPQVLMAEAITIAKKYGVTGGSQAVLAGQMAFVEQRGNLSGSRKIMDALAKRAVAKSADLGDVGKMAAKIDQGLSTQGAYRTDEDLRNKAVLSTLDVQASQTKEGSINFGDLAKQFPKLAGLASQFAGDAAKNMSLITMIAQKAEQGTAPNAATAATFAKNFASGLGKRSDQMRDIAGVDVYRADGKKIGLQELITKLIVNTSKKKLYKGKTLNQDQQLLKILPNIRQNQAIQEFVAVYQGAGGGKAGKAALDAEFDKFSGSDQQLNEDLAVRMATLTNQSARFNVELEEVTTELSRELLPALKDAAPSIVTFVGGVGKMAAWAVNNPGLAIVRAIELSILRAGIESVFRATIERAIMGGAPGLSKGSGGRPGGTLVGGSGASPGTFGKIAGVAMAAAVAYVAYDIGTTLGKAYLDTVFAGQKEALNRHASEEADQYIKTKKIKASLDSGGELSDEDRAALKEQLYEGVQRQAVAETRAKRSPMRNMFGDAVNAVTGTKSEEQLAREVSDTAMIEQLKVDNALLRSMLGGTLKVHVENAAEIASTGAGNNALDGVASIPVPGVSAQYGFTG